MISLVSKQSGYKNNKLVIVFESDNLSELVANGVSKYATDIALAEFGLQNACLNSQDPPFPVDENGDTSDDYEKLAKIANSKGVKYWKRFYLMSRI